LHYDHDAAINNAHQDALAAFKVAGGGSASGPKLNGKSYTNTSAINPFAKNFITQ